MRSDRSPGLPRGSATAGTSCSSARSILLAWNPYTLLDAGFQLSFAAVVAIFVAVPRAKRLPRGLPGAAEARRRCVAVSLACGLATAPILWLQFGRIPLYSVPANALAAPVVAPLLGLSFAAAVADAVLARRRRADRVASTAGSPPTSPGARGSSAACRARRSSLVAGGARRSCWSCRRGGRRVPAGRTADYACRCVADELKPVYLLTGSDRPKIDRAAPPPPRPLRRGRGRAALGAARRSGEDAVAACNAMGLFAAGGRLVLVDEVERWKAADAKAVAEYLAAPAPETVLALVGDELTQGLAAREGAARRRASVLVYEVSKRELPKWVAEQFARHGVEGERRRLPRAGRARRRQPARARERGRQARRLGRRRARSARTRSSCWSPRARSRRRSSLTDAWGRRDVAGGARPRCESILERSTRSGEIHMLVGRLAAHVRRVQACQTPRRRGGPRPRTRPRELKMHPFAAQKAFDAGAELLGRGAARGDRRARGPRPRAEGRQPASGRARAPADARRDHARPRAGASSEPRSRSRRRAARPAPSCGRRCSRGARPCVAARSTSGRACGARRRSRGVAGGDRGLEALRQRLHGRAEADVLVAAGGRGPDALLLLLDVRHSVKRPAVRARRW